MKKWFVGNIVKNKFFLIKFNIYIGKIHGNSQNLLTSQLNHINNLWPTPVIGMTPVMFENRNETDFSPSFLTMGVSSHSPFEFERNQTYFGIDKHVSVLILYSKHLLDTPNHWLLQNYLLFDLTFAWFDLGVYTLQLIFYISVFATSDIRDMTSSRTLIVT